MNKNKFTITPSDGLVGAREVRHNGQIHNGRDPGEPRIHTDKHGFRILISYLCESVSIRGSLLAGAGITKRLLKAVLRIAAGIQLGFAGSPQRVGVEKRSVGAPPARRFSRQSDAQGSANAAGGRMPGAATPVGGRFATPGCGPVARKQKPPAAVPSGVALSFIIQL